MLLCSSFQISILTELSLVLFIHLFILLSNIWHCWQLGSYFSVQHQPCRCHPRPCMWRGSVDLQNTRKCISPWQAMQLCCSKTVFQVSMESFHLPVCFWEVRRCATVLYAIRRDKSFKFLRRKLASIVSDKYLCTSAWKHLCIRERSDDLLTCDAL